MSLINDMLRDLDRRHGGTGALPNEVRPLPPERARSAWQPLALVLVGVLAVAGWLHFAGITSPESAPARPQPATETLPAAPVAKETPHSLVPAAGTVAVAPVPASVTPAAADQLRLDVTLSRLPAAPPPAPARKPIEAVAKEPMPAAADKLPAPPKAAEPPAKIAPAEPQGASGGIEKRPRIETPKERAEQDYRKAYALLSRGRPEEAVPLLKNALGEDAGHVSARLALAGVLSQSGRPDEAFALLEEGLRLDPSRPALALAAARALVAMGRFEAAQQALSRASANAQADAEFRAFHAAVLQRLTLHKEAVAEYQAALRLAPQAGVWWMGLGISLEAEGRSAEARDAFQRARASNSLSPELDRFVEQKIK